LASPSNLSVYAGALINAQENSRLPELKADGSQAGLAINAASEVGCAGLRRAFPDTRHQAPPYRWGTPLGARAAAPTSPWSYEMYLQSKSATALPSAARTYRSPSPTPGRSPSQTPGYVATLAAAPSGHGCCIYAAPPVAAYKPPAPPTANGSNTTAFPRPCLTATTQMQSPVPPLMVGVTPVAQAVPNGVGDAVQQCVATALSAASQAAAAANGACVAAQTASNAAKVAAHAAEVAGGMDRRVPSTISTAQAGSMRILSASALATAAAHSRVAQSPCHGARWRCVSPPMRPSAGYVNGQASLSSTGALASAVHAAATNPFARCSSTVGSLHGGSHASMPGSLTSGIGPATSSTRGLGDLRDESVQRPRRVYPQESSRKLVLRAGSVTLAAGGGILSPRLVAPLEMDVGSTAVEMAAAALAEQGFKGAQEALLTPSTLAPLTARGAEIDGGSCSVRPESPTPSQLGAPRSMPVLSRGLNGSASVASAASRPDAPAMERGPSAPSRGSLSGTDERWRAACMPINGYVAAPTSYGVCCSHSGVLTSQPASPHVSASASMTSRAATKQPAAADSTAPWSRSQAPLGMSNGDGFSERQYDGLEITPLNEKPFKAISSIAQRAHISLVERLRPKPGDKPLDPALVQELREAVRQL